MAFVPDGACAWANGPSRRTSGRSAARRTERGRRCMWTAPAKRRIIDARSLAPSVPRAGPSHDPIPARPASRLRPLAPGLLDGAHFPAVAGAGVARRRGARLRPGGARPRRSRGVPRELRPRRPHVRPGADARGRGLRGGARGSDGHAARMGAGRERRRGLRATSASPPGRRRFRAATARGRPATTRSSRCGSARARGRGASSSTRA